MRVLIVGSAPDIELPKHHDFDLVIAANGGAELVRKGGFKVDHLATTVFLCTAPRDYNQ
jgi:hypothetical protein